MQVNQKTGKIYNKFLRRTTPSGVLAPIKSIMVPLPTRELLKGYEAKKMEFTVNLNKKIMMMLDKDKVKLAKPLAEKQETYKDMYDVLTKTHPNWTKTQKCDTIAEMKGKHRTTIFKSIDAAENKLKTVQLPKEMSVSPVLMSVNRITN